MPPARCAGCDVPLVPNKHPGPVPAGHKRLISRGRCTTCYERARPPRPKRTRTKSPQRADSTQSTEDVEATEELESIEPPEPPEPEYPTLETDPFGWTREELADACREARRLLGLPPGD